MGVCHSLGVGEALPVQQRVGDVLTGGGGGGQRREALAAGWGLGAGCRLGFRGWWCLEVRVEIAGRGGEVAGLSSGWVMS